MIKYILLLLSAFFISACDTTIEAPVTPPTTTSTTEVTRETQLYPHSGAHTQTTTTIAR